MLLFRVPRLVVDIYIYISLPLCLHTNPSHRPSPLSLFNFHFIDPLNPQQIAEALSMGTWRLRGRVCPPIEALTARIENGWRAGFPDLSLYPLPQVLFTITTDT